MKYKRFCYTWAFDVGFQTVERPMMKVADHGAEHAEDLRLTYMNAELKGAKHD